MKETWAEINARLNAERDRMVERVMRARKARTSRKLYPILFGNLWFAVWLEARFRLDSQLVSRREWFMKYGPMLAFQFSQDVTS